MDKFNVMDHDMVPEHYLVSEKEETRILEELDITKDQLPKIRLDDPCMLFLERKYGPIKEGSIIRIVRKSDITDEAKVYRVAVSTVGKTYISVEDY